MGQYYRGAILAKTNFKKGEIVVRQAYDCYIHNNGAKIMEHSYVGNHYVQAYEQALANKFYGYPFVWVGDYADDKFGVDVYTEANNFIDNKAYRKAIKKGYRVVYGEMSTDIYDGNHKIDISEFVDKVITKDNVVTYKYIINLDKKLAVEIPTAVKDELVIHPLPLLCASGNGQSGSDYYGINEDLVGTWAYDRIGIDNELPRGVTLIKADFKEE